MSRRILFVIESLFPLGPAQQLNLLARQLIFQEFDIHIVTLDDTSTQTSALVRSGFTVHSLSKFTGAITSELSQAGALKALIDQLDPAIVHSWCGAANPVTGLALRGTESPRLVATELSQPPNSGFARSLALRKFFRRSEKLVVPHESLKQTLIERGTREHRIAVVPNAASFAVTDRDRARRRLRSDLSLPESAVVAMAVAPLVPRFRLKDLIWATDLLACIRDDFHFVLVGTGPHEWRLRTFAAQTEGAAHVHFAGHHEFAYQHIAGADFYWHSHLLEPLPGNMLAAMTIGIPCVSVFGDGTRELIIPQETGLAVSYGARDEFARWTKYLIEQTGSASQLTMQAKDYVDREFRVKPMADGYMAVYNWCE